MESDRGDRLWRRRTTKRQIEETENKKADRGDRLWRKTEETDN
jgi:hypothetical protein